MHSTNRHLLTYLLITDIRMSHIYCAIYNKLSIFMTVINAGPGATVKAGNYF